jgi:hypothetical protein
LARQLLYSIQSIQERIAVDEQRFGRLADVGMMVEIGRYRVDQLAVMLFVVKGQRANQPFAKLLQYGGVF